MQTQPGKAQKSKKRPASPRRKGMYICVGMILLFFGVYSALGFLGVPYYLTNTLAESFNKKTGMVFDPGRIIFNPFTFHFSSQQAKITSESGTPLASLVSLTADLAPFSLLRLDLVCRTVTLSELSLNITREKDGSYNLAKLLRQKQDGGPSEILDFSDLPFFFSLNNIAIKNSKITFIDTPAGKTHSIEQLQLDLPTFSNIPFQANQYLRPSFSAVINGSAVELTGQAHMGDSSDQKTSLSCNLHAIDLPVYAEYLPINLPLIFTGGKADGKINILFDPASQQDDKLSIDFELQLSETEIQNAEETIFIIAPMTEVKGVLQPVARSILFTNISSQEPVFQTVGGSILSSLDILFKTDKKALPPGAIGGMSTPSGAFSLAIDELMVKEGTFHLWTDKAAKQPETTWDALQLKVNGFSSSAPIDTKETGRFLLSSRKAGSPSSFSWEGDLTSAESFSGNMTLDNVNFKDLLLSLGADQDLSVAGLAALKGQLSVSIPQDSGSAMGYKLNEAELIVQDFKLLDDKLPIISAPTLKMTSLATAYKTIHFGKVVINDGTVLLPISRIPDIFKKFTAGKYLLQEIDFQGQISLLPEEKGKQKSTFPGISLQAKDLDSPEKAKDNFSLSAKTTGGGNIEGNGNLRIVPFSLTINTECNNLSAAEAFPLLSQSPLLNSINGVLSGKGSFSLPKKSFTGDLQITKASLRRSADSVFSWTDMSLQAIDFTSEPLHLGIDAISLKQPHFSWPINPEDAGPLQQLASFFQENFPALPREKQSEEKSKNSISPVDIKEIEIQEGTVLIQDKRLKPQWKGDITEFTGTLKNVDMAALGTDSEFSFTGKLQDAPFTLTGAVDVFAPEINGDFHLSLNDYPLASFNEQLAPLTDINSKNGLVDLQLDSTIKDSQYQNSGFILFSKVRPRSEKADSALALALLTGPEDTFQLDFDFARPAPLGKTIFIQEILAFFQTKVVKADVSPFLLASGDFTDLIGSELIEFEAGQSSPTDKAMEILSRYAELLTSHPLLGLELAAEVNRDDDAPAIKEQLQALEQNRVEMENQKRLAAWQQEKAIFDQKVAEQQKKPAAKDKGIETKPPPAVLKDYIPLQAKPVSVNDAMLIELAKKRSQAVSQYLAEQKEISPDRLKIIALKRVADSKEEQSMSGVRIALTAIK